MVQENLNSTWDSPRDLVAFKMWAGERPTLKR